MPWALSEVLIRLLSMICEVAQQPEFHGNSWQVRSSASATLEFGGTRLRQTRQVRPLNLTAGGIGNDVLDMHSPANPPQPEKKIERFENTSEVLSKNMIGTSETFATDLDIGDIGITFTRSPRGGDPVDISRTILGLLRVSLKKDVSDSAHFLRTWRML